MSAADRNRDALHSLAVLFLLLLALDGFARIAARPGGRTHLLMAAAWGGLVAFGVAAFEGPSTLAFTPEGWIGIGRRAGTFSDPNALGVGIGLLVPLLFVAAFSTSMSRGGRLAAGTALLLFPVALERSGSRTGFLLLGVVLVVVAVWLLSSRPRARLWVAGGILVSFLLLAAVFRLAPRGGSTAMGGLVTRIGAAFSAASFEDLSSHRPLFWRTAFEMMETEPLSGCGLGGFPYEFPVFYGRRHSRITVTDNATSTLLDVGAECGIPALLLALAAVIPILVRATDSVFGSRDLSSTESRLGARAAGAVLLGFAVASFTGSHIRFPEVALLVALSAALLPASSADSGSYFSPPRRLAGVLAFSGIVASCLALLPTLQPKAAFRAGPWVGVYGPEIHEERSQAWLGPRAFRRIREGESRLSLTFRNQRPDGRPVLVSADIEGRPSGSLSIAAGARGVLSLSSLPRESRALRLRFEPTFVPVRLTGLPDFRELSLLLEADETLSHETTP